MITYQKETYESSAEDIKLIVSKHHKEVSSYNKIELGIDWYMYKFIYDQGKLRIYTVRDSEILVGYVTFIINNHIRYMTAKVAENDVVFTLPKYRKHFAGYKLIKFAVRDLSKECQAITLRLKASDKSLRLAERLGFKLTDYTLVMEI